MPTGSTTLDERLERYFASDPAAIHDPAPLFEDVRAAGRAVAHGPMVIVTGHQDVKELIRDDARLSNQWGQGGTRAAAIRARLAPEAQHAFDEVAAFEANFLSRTDGEQHERLRAVVHRAFTPRAIAALTDAVVGYTDALLGELDTAGPVDLMELAYTLPLQVVCDLLGAPRADQALIHDWSLKIARNRGGVEEGPLLVAHEAERQFAAYVRELADAHRRSPGSGGALVAALLDASEGDRLTDTELAATFVVLLFAGHETTTSLIGNGLFELLRAPDQWERLVAEPAIVPQAVDELLRHVSPVQFLVRFATVDHERAGVPLIAGTSVVAMLSAANRDPAVFADPHRLDVLRDARQHIAFGFGPHFCIGTSLARLEAETVLRALVERHPGAALAEPDDALTWGGNAMFRRLDRLPVTLA